MREATAAKPAPSLGDVRAFWDANPLFSGESHHTPGTREFFEEFERTTLYEHSGQVAPIFTRGIGPGVKVLDVGCGVGFWVGQFCKLGASVTACDLTERAVAIVRRRLGFYGLAADVIQGNAESLPYPDQAFDHINCQGVIHHTPDRAACVREFHRVLRKDGTLCLSVYYKNVALRSGALFKATTLLSRPFLKLRGRGRENMLAAPSPEELVRMYDGSANPIGVAYTRNEFRALLADRFEVLDQQRFGFPRRAFPLPLTNGMHRLLSNLFGLMIVFRCRKLETERLSEGA